MVDHMPTGPVETGAPMDYEEHRRTYLLFIALTKYGTLACLSFLIAMAFGFFISGGFFSALVLFVAICSAGAYLLANMPTHVS